MLINTVKSELLAENKALELEINKITAHLDTLEKRPIITPNDTTLNQLDENKLVSKVISTVEKRLRKNNTIITSPRIR